MSRTKHKYLRLFTACGDNREYYRLRRRKVRQHNKNQIRTLMANYDIDEMNDRIYNYELPKEDDRDEPTDGHYAISRVKDFPYTDLVSKQFITRKIKSKLKNP